MTEVDYRAMYLKVRDELAELQQRHEQEPVGYAIVKNHGKVNILDFDFDFDVAEQLSEGKYPAYITPPQRIWVGLTDEEVDECYYWKDRQWTTDELVRHVEAKLKQKNGFAEEKNT